MLGRVMSTTIVALIGISVALTAWLIVVVSYALATRARNLVAGPATMELGTEPPAVVNLLVTRCELTADAADATLLDLAARRILELHQPGDDPAELLVRVREPAPAGLISYEQRVFDRVRTVAADRFVSLPDMTRQFADGGPGWLRHLRTEVVADAVARGLVRTRRFGSVIALTSILVAMAVACFGVVPFVSTDGGRADDLIGVASVVGWFVATIVVAMVLLVAAVAPLRRPTHTSAGKQTGAKWLGVGRWLAAHENLADLPPAAVAVWDQYLAYGVALGVNPVASRAVDLRVGRTVSLRSAYTGVPRLVVVRYPRDPMAYTQAGVRLLWSVAMLLVWAGVGYLWLAHGRDWPPVLRWAVFVVGVLAVVRTAYKAVRSVPAKFRPVTVRGEVLVLHPYRLTRDGPSRWFQIVVDDGVRDRTRPWLVRADRIGATAPGDICQLRAQRWTRYVLQLSVIDHATNPRPRVAPTPTGPPG
jgi:hypothetical protein